MRILLIANTGWYLYKFREKLIRTLIARGDQIGISCPYDAYSQKLVDDLGVNWYPIPANPRRIVAHKELIFTYQLFKACRQFKPEVCLTYTPRVNCYITLIPLNSLGIRLIRNISGIGDSLQSGKKIQSLIAVYLYRRARLSYWTFYQNEQDMQLGLEEKFSNDTNSSLLPGSGVDLERFTYHQRSEHKPLMFLMAARLIPAKGYLDFIELARQHQNNATSEFHLAGAFSDESGISRNTFDTLIQDSGVVYHGYIEDLAPLYKRTDMFILPSLYGEGLPRVMLEAAATGCALLAYGNPGSNRAISEDNANGWSTPDSSVSAMNKILTHYLSLTHAKRLAMSQSSRQHVENGFSESVVINAYLARLQK